MFVATNNRNDNKAVIGILQHFGLHYENSNLVLCNAWNHNTKTFCKNERFQNYAYCEDHASSLWEYNRPIGQDLIGNEKATRARTVHVIDFVKKISHEDAAKMNYLPIKVKSEIREPQQKKVRHS